MSETSEILYKVKNGEISIEEAESFTPPAWFKEDVTNDRHYSNSYLSSVDLAAQRP